MKYETMMKLLTWVTGRRSPYLLGILIGIIGAIAFSLWDSPWVIAVFYPMALLLGIFHTALKGAVLTRVREDRRQRQELAALMDHVRKTLPGKDWTIMVSGVTYKNER